MSKEKFCNSPEDYRAWSRTIDRQWNQALPSAEFAIVRFIFDRTAGWAKEWEVIPLRHFTQCVVSKKDGANYGGVYSVSLNTIISCLRSLVDRGAIQREPTGKSFRYAIDYKWNPPMKIPKRLKNRCNFCTGDGCKNCTHDGAKIAHKEEEKIIPTEKGSSGLAPVTLDKEGIIRELDKVKQHSASRRAAHKLEGYFCRGSKEKGGFVPTERALAKSWEDLHVEEFPETPCAAMPKRALHMVRGYCREWNGRNKDKEFMLDYLPWLFRNWSMVRKTSLSWMTDSPEIPQLMFVANSKLRIHLEEGWSKRSELQALSKLTPREREVAVLRSKGVDKEAAESMATEKRTNEDSLKRIQLEQRKLEVMQKSSAPLKARTSIRSVRPTATTGNKMVANKLPSWEDTDHHQEEN